MMWKYWILGGIAGIIMSAGLFGNAYAEREVSQLNVDLILNKDASLEVTESIQYDVGTETYPQFQRTIPNNGYTITVNAVSVDGASFPYTTSQTDSGKQITLSKQSYQFQKETQITIAYTVDRPLKKSSTTVRASADQQQTIPVYTKGAVQFFPEGVQFRWDAVDNLWNSPIRNTQVTLELPQSLSQISSLETQCFTGEAGSDKSDCSISQTADSINFTANRELQNEFFTVVTAFGSGVVDTPEKVTKWRDNLNSSDSQTDKNASGGNLPVYLGIIGGIFLGISLTFFIGVLRKKSAKKKKKRSTRKDSK